MSKKIYDMQLVSRKISKARCNQCGEPIHNLLYDSSFVKKILVDFVISNNIIFCKYDYYKGYSGKCKCGNYIGVYDVKHARYKKEIIEIKKKNETEIGAS